MWRHNLSFLVAALIISLVWAVSDPQGGLLEDLAMVGLGFFVILLLGNEIFIRALAPGQEEAESIARLLQEKPAWKRHFFLIGAIAGFTGAAAFFIVGKMSDSIWVAGIPIGVFLVSWATLQYLIP